MDALVQGTLDFAQARLYGSSNPTTGEELAVVAVGGYGRQELAPGSDIDLLFLCPYKRTPHVEQVSEFLLYKLWDLGLKVGQAVRSVAETIKLAQERPHRPDRAARGAPALGLARPVRAAAQELRARDHGRARRRLRRGQARRARPAPPAHGRFALHARAQHQGGQGRAARPADAVMDRPVHQAQRRSGRAGPPGAADPPVAGPLPALAPLPVDRALPPALPDRPRRGPADLRPAARDRPAHGLPRAQPGPGRRALHEALLPGRQGRGLADADLLRGARGASRSGSRASPCPASASAGARSTASWSRATA